MIERRATFTACLIPVIAGLALVGCASRDESLPDDVAYALAQAFTKGDVDACVAVYTDDAEIISGNGPVVRGEKAIREFFKDQVSRDISFNTDSALSVVRGDLAVEQGTYRVRDVRRGKDVEWGDYLNVWRKSGGKWRTFRSMYNTTISPSGGVSVLQDSDAGQGPSAPPPPAPPAGKH